MSSEAATGRITSRFQDLDALEAEFESNLSWGRAFVLGASDVTERQRYELVLEHPETGESLGLEAEAVWIQQQEPGAGVGFELVGFDDDVLQSVKSFVQKKKTEARSTLAGDLYSRVRMYNTAEQLRVAREGDQAERIALERIYGKNVWDVLIHNPRITVPEVTRIARNPKIPKHLVDTITSNQGWISSSTLRRSLVMNPQVTGAPLEKVLRAYPRMELTLMAKQSNYPLAVRQMVKKIQGR